MYVLAVSKAIKWSVLVSYQLVPKYTSYDYFNIV